MQEAEEQDTCRICSAPAEPDQPLFHPCKCSGTIRYIHQDCLTTWLAHSKKKTCDVCKHPYSFTKVYAPDMPSRLPTILLARRISQHAFLALLFILRAIAVAIIWLAVLPWATVWTWRMYFSMGESTAWYVSNLERPPDSHPVHYQHRMIYEPTVPPPQSSIRKFTSHPLWMALSADIFTGQIIASLIVLTFVAVFLLREWISQNARPGVFEDEEVFPDMPPVVNDPPPQPAPNPPVPPAPLPPQIPALPDPAELERRQQNAMRALDSLRAAEAFRHRSADQDRGRIQPGGSEGEESGARKAEPERKKKRVQRADSETEGDSDEVGVGRVRKRTPTLRVPSSNGRVRTVRRRTTRNPGRSTSPVTNATDGESSDSIYPFTFHASPSDPATEASEQLPRSNLEFHSSHSSPTRRPRLLTSTLATPIQEKPLTFPLSRTPLESPKLATYRAPEELNAEPESSNPYEFFGFFGVTTNDMAELERSPPHGLDIPRPSSANGESAPARRVTPPSSSHPTEGDINTFDATKDENGPLLHSNFAQHSPVSGRRQSVVFSGDDFDASAPSGIADDFAQSDFDYESEHHKYFRLATPPPPPATGADIPQQDLPPPQPPAQVRDHEGEADFRRDEDDEDEEEVDEDVEELLWHDAHWDEIEVEEVPGGLEANEGGEPLPGAGPRQPNGRGEPNGDGDAGLPQDLADDLEGNVEDDMEGAMEAIGMRGPIYSVFQNAALMIFVLATAIGVGVWIPFTIGKCVALLSLNPKRVVQIIHLPIKLIRIITDPEVDFIIFVIQIIYRDFFKKNFGFIGRFASFLMKATVGEEWRVTYSDLVNKTYTDTVEFFSGSPVTPLNGTVSTETILGKFPAYLGPTEPYFTLLGREVRLGVMKFESSWSRMTMGSGPGERIFAISIGYAVVGFVLALYLNILTVGNARTATRAVRNAVRQQLLVIKVAAFIFIELVLFPLGCGIVLDLCTVWLFPEANIQSRIAFFAQAPLTAMFYHWIAGTMFMYSFAVLLSGCRAVMRPGAMWFIKDPQDQNSHPIRDILDRPTLTQLRKIFMSAILYSVVVACVVGSVAGLLALGNKSILPFRWKNREPLSNVPVDLLFLHLVLPYTMHYFRPKRAIKHLATIVWKYLSKKFRLTSYFFGDNCPEEQYTPRRWFGAGINDSELSSRRDGTFRRVPATDNLALPRDMRATARVTETGVPYDKEAEELVKVQNAEALKAKRDINLDYRVVYIPPSFRYRIFAFILSMWVIGAAVLGVSVALPVTLGRSVFGLFTSREVHDGYSLILGFYLLVACYLCGRAVDRLDKRRQRRSPEGPRADLRILVMKRGFLWLTKISFMIMTLGILLPILVTLVMDLYVILPIRLALDPTLNPKIKIVDAWALGLLYVKIAFHVHRIQPHTRISRGLQHIVAHGWLRPDPFAATRDVILPVGGGLLGMILFPGVLFRLFQYLFPAIGVDNKFVFMHVYPGIFVVVGLMQSSRYFDDIVASWSQAIRDKEFLVEMRLRNHEPGEEPQQEEPEIAA